MAEAHQAVAIAFVLGAVNIVLNGTALGDYFFKHTDDGLIGPTMGGSPQ
jgi:hypothetical protein